MTILARKLISRQEVGDSNRRVGRKENRRETGNTDGRKCAIVKDVVHYMTDTLL